MDSAATLLGAISFLIRDADGCLHLRAIKGSTRPCTLEPELAEATVQARSSGSPARVRVSCGDGQVHDMLLLPGVDGIAAGVLLDVATIATAQAQTLENLVNQIAHDVRNHAFTIGLQAEMGVRRAAGNADLKGHFDAVLRQVDVLKGYLEKLLAFGRPVHLAPTQVDLTAFVHEQVQRFQFGWEPAAPPLAISVATEGDPGRVCWDARSVGVVLAILLDNAVRATPRVASVNVKVTGEPLRVQIEVRDQGPGIPDETLVKLATPMAVRRAGGAGLGLAIARKIVQAHGGSVTLDTGAGGTTARVVLPREVPAA